MLKVSCIIPVHNGVTTIERAIASAYQSGCDEVLVYDDRSKDGTDSLLDKLRNEYPFKQIYNPSKSGIFRGVNFARNWLIENAKHDLVLPLDCDDELINPLPLMNAYHEHTWVYGDYMQLSQGIRNYYSGIPVGMLHAKNVTQATFLFNKGDWESVGGYDPDFAYAEDYGLQCAFVNAGIQGVYVRGIVYNRHLNERGNERTALATQHWFFYRDMARRKYPNVFNGFG